MKSLRYLLFLLAPAKGLASTCPVDTLHAYTWQAEDNQQGATITPSQVAAAIDVDAESAQMQADSVQLLGKVHLSRGKEQFLSERVHYDRQKEIIRTDSPFTYGNATLAVQAKTGEYQLNEDTGTFTQLDYYLKNSGARGHADKILVDQKNKQETLENPSFTTCDRLKPAWQIRAKEMALFHKTGEGKARGAQFFIRNTPILYLPYFSFPLDDRRKTGFLLPRINLSETNGLDISTPYYLNLSPNQDMTITPRILSKRGLMLGSEYRYLLPWMSGSFAGTYLARDQKDQEKSHRFSFKTLHNANPFDGLYLSLNYQRVSDKRYIKDFENTLDLSDEAFLPSYFAATYLFDDHWQLRGEFRDYQVVNPIFTDADRPYALLPRLQLLGQYMLPYGFYFNTETELSHFYKKQAPSGWRLNETLRLRYAYEKTYGFIRPEFIYRFTQYELRHHGEKQRITRSLPTLALDSGLYFDRQIHWFGHEATQSLSPRLFYLYTPYRDQHRIPDFDTALIDSSYDAMFLTNRFIGKDRIGDANQLTAALSTTVTDNLTGQELAYFAVGQIQYFKDRRVSLYDDIARTSHSNVIAEGGVQVYDRFKVRGLIHRDIDAQKTEKSLLGITYQHSADSAFSLTHLYDSQYFKQLDFSGVWRLNDDWRGFWRWNYSIAHNKTIDALLGVEYAACCYGVRLMARRQHDSFALDQDAKLSVYLEFALKGLGNIGSDTAKTLRDIVPDYRPLAFEKQ